MARLHTPVARRWSDLDLLGHVNNVTVLVYLEEARVALLRSLVGEVSWPPAVVVARHEVDYLRPLALRPEPVVVQTWVDRIGTTSYDIGYEVHDEGVVAVTARSVMVCFDPATQRKAPMPEVMREALAGLRDDER